MARWSWLLWYRCFFAGLTGHDLCCWPVFWRDAKHAAARVPEPHCGVDWLGGIFHADLSNSVVFDTMLIQLSIFANISALVCWCAGGHTGISSGNLLGGLKIIFYWSHCQLCDANTLCGCVCIRRLCAAATGIFLASFAFSSLVRALLCFDALDSKTCVFGVKGGAQRVIGFERTRYWWVYQHLFGQNICPWKNQARLRQRRHRTHLQNHY